MLSWLDAAIILAFLGYAALSGLRSRAVSSKNLEEYFLAGRSLPGWKAGLSMAATQFAADTPLLITGLIATAGIFSLWRMWIYALAFLLMGFVLGAAWRRASVLTDAELAEQRYDGGLATALRGVKAIYFGTVFNCTVMAMVLLAATRIAEPFLTWNAWLPSGVFEPVVDFVRWANVPLTTARGSALWAELSANNLLSLLAVVAVTTLYSTTGGLRAVVDTDVVQFGIAMVATAVYAYIVIDLIGGLDVIPTRLAEHLGPDRANELLAFTPSRAPDIGWAALGVIAIQWLAQMNADGTGYLAQRTMACKSEQDARTAAVIFVVAQVLVRSLVWIAIGLGLLVLLPGGMDAAAREATFVTGVAEHLPSGLRGLMLAGMLAALASTIDTHLNWGSSYWTNDIYRRLVCQLWQKREPSGRSLVWVARGANLLILALAIVILTQLDSIQSAWQTSLLLGAGMGVPLVLRWLWWRMTALGELSAIVASSALSPLLLYTVESEGTRLLLVASAAAVITVIVSSFGKKAPTPGLIEFYRRVRPPGFWGPVARAAGLPDDGRLHLWRGLVLTVGSSFAIFSTLVGLGSWMFGSPAPIWLPWRGPFIALCLSTSFAITWALWRFGHRFRGDRPARDRKVEAA